MQPQNSHFRHVLLMVVGGLALPAIWVFLKYGLGITDRFLPSPIAVLQAVQDIEPAVWVHFGYTSLRLLVGFIFGVFVGISLALQMVRSASAQSFFMPILQSLRVVPAAAIVPFFLLWFGFSEWGRYLMVVAAIAFNIAIAAWQILQHTPENHRAFFHSIQTPPGRMIWHYCLPRIIESILPTLRFSMALAIGAVTVSELLGSQVGLGYLIQTSRSTFSLHVLFLATILLGIMSAIVDGLLVLLWRRLLFWKH